LDDFAAGTSRQARQHGGGFVGQKPHRTIGEREVRSAGVGRPEVEHPTGVGKSAGRLEAVLPGATRRSGHDRQQVRLANAEHDVCRAGRPLADAGVPPAVLQVRTRRPFAQQQRVAGAVDDRGEGNPGVEIKQAILDGRHRTGDAEVAGEGNPRVGPQAGLGSLHAVIGRAQKGLHDRVPRMRRIGQRDRQDAKRLLCLSVQSILLQKRQHFERPTGVGPEIAGEQRPRPRRQRLLGIVMMLQSQGDLLQLTLTGDPSSRGPHLLDRAEQQADQHRDDGDDDQQLNQSEGRPATTAAAALPERCRRR